MLQSLMKDKDAKGKMTEEMMKGFEEKPELAKYKPVAEAAIDQLFNVADGFLRDADAAALNLNLSDAGINFGVVAQFEGGSYLAKLFGGQKNTSEPMLAGLPEGTYLVYGGSVSDPKVAAKFFDDVAGPVLAKLKEVPDSQTLVDYVEASKTALTAATGSRVGMFAPTGGFGQAPLLQQVMIREGNVEQLMTAEKKMAELMPELTKTFAALAGGDADADADETMKMTYTPDAKTVAGVSFAKYTTTLPNTGDMGPNPATFMFGPEGPVTYSGVVDGKSLTVGGLNDQQIESVIAGVKGGKSPLADMRGVKLVNEQLPKNRSAVFYLAPDELVRSGLNIGRQMGFNVPVTLPDDLPPVGVTAGSMDDSLVVDGFVSKDLIAALVVATLQVQQQFGGGGAGGGL